MKKTGLNGHVYEFNVDYRHFNPTNFYKYTPIIHLYFIAKYDILLNVSAH